MFLQVLPQLTDYLPYILTISIGTRPALAVQVLSGKPLDNPAPILCTVVWTVLFVGVAIWRFGREEF